MAALFVSLLDVILRLFSLLLSLKKQIFDNNFHFSSLPPPLPAGYIVSALIFAPIIAFVRPFTCGFITEMPMLEGEEEAFEDDFESADSDPKKALVQERKDMTYLDSLREFLSIWLSAIRFRDFSLLSLAWFLSNMVVKYFLKTKYERESS